MNFQYSGAFCSGSPEAYERLLLDVLAGDTTLFMRRDSVEAAWRWVTPVLDRWAEQSETTLPTYAAGTWGPPEAEHLIANGSRAWRRF
jgi:glucose-6-phosphate 1-dehydrogenase